MIGRGDLYWVDLGEPTGSAPGKQRPVVVVQSDRYTSSALATVLVAVVTSNTALAAMPGNVFLPAATSGLPRDSVVNVTSLVTVDKDDLRDRVGTLPFAVARELDDGLRRVLHL